MARKKLDGLSMAELVVELQRVIDEDLRRIIAELRFKVGRP